MNILSTSPVAFINAVTPIEGQFIIFCATWLGILALFWVVVFLLFRPLREHSILAPLENLAKRWNNLMLVFVSVLTSYTLSVVLKNYFKIGRPDILNINLRPLMQLSDYGFPSGHASFYSALAVSVFFIDRRAGKFAGLLALVVGAARILAGVHTPLDILGGFILGTLTAVVIDFIAKKLAFHHEG